MSPFRILGLDRQADATQVKRAYARLLRQHRPDEDPEGFQRIHEAYQACLEQLRWREQGWEDDEDEDDEDGTDLPTEAPAATDAGGIGSADAGSSTPIEAMAAPADLVTLDETEATAPADGFDADAFGEELGERMRSDTRQALEAWLQGHHDLYSLDRKRVLQYGVVDLLEVLEPATAARHFEAVTRFFGLDGVAGVDGWLQHRLYEVQRRFGDAAEFERILRTHAGAQADWADQVLARELLQSRNWMRRIFLIACPGLPGRTGALARALQAADPDTAASQLNRQATRFWDRATARNALRWERLGFMAARTALWTLCFSGFIALVERDKGFGGGFPSDWAAFFAIAGAIWLAYAVLVLAVLRFRDFNQSRMQWDWLLLVTAGGLGCGIAAVAAGANGTLAFIMTTIVWVGARNDRQGGYSSSQVASLAAGATGFGLALLALHMLAADAVPARYLACAAAAYAFGSQALHDAWQARRQGITLPAARLHVGGLWRLALVQSILLAGLAAVRALWSGQSGA